VCKTLRTLRIDQFDAPDHRNGSGKAAAIGISADDMMMFASIITRSDEEQIRAVADNKPLQRQGRSHCR
jgi:hypothetical protein